MAITIERLFATREKADLAIERLVQEHGIERTDIFVTADGADNSSGEEISGGDASTVDEAERDDAALATPIKLSVDINDDAAVATVEAALNDLGGQ